MCEELKTETELEWKAMLVFPPLSEDGSLDTLLFLSAATATLRLLDKFGTVFAPVKYDMSQNIEKIKKRFNEDTEKYCSLQKLVLSERAEGLMMATDALLWLTRALHFIELLLEQILAEKDSENASECLRKHFTEAYNKSVRKYHSWMTQKMFVLICRMSPTRSQLFNSLDDSTDIEEKCRFLGVLFKSLQSNRTEIHRFYALQNIDDSSVV